MSSFNLPVRGCLSPHKLGAFSSDPIYMLATRPNAHFGQPHGGDGSLCCLPALLLAPAPHRYLQKIQNVLFQSPRSRMFITPQVGCLLIRSYICRPPVRMPILDGLVAETVASAALSSSSSPTPMLAENTKCPLSISPFEDVYYKSGSDKLPTYV